MKKRFFGIETLFVFIIIGFFIGIFFVTIQSSHRKTQITAYMTYAEQMQRLVAGSIALGHLDGYTASNLTCLGKYMSEIDCVEDKQLNTNLEKISELPQPAATSPYNEKLGVSLRTRVIDEKEYIEVRVGISNDTSWTKEVCDQFGWGSDNSSYCYIHIRKTH